MFPATEDLDLATKHLRANTSRKMQGKKQQPNSILVHPAAASAGSWRKNAVVSSYHSLKSFPGR